MSPLPKRSGRARLRTLTAAILVSASLFASAWAGALFTTDVDGTVNVNHYASKADVYLNGGPGPNAPCDAAGVPDGVYVFQITNPSGSVLLSSDDIAFREFTVTGGIITSSNNHSVVPGDCGSVRVQAAPFDDTPNNGGVYKAWIALKADYEAAGNQFLNRNSKTDNFHVEQPSQEPELADLNVYKFYDKNANGEWDGDEVPLFGWAMTASDVNGSLGTQLTQSPDGLTTWTNLSVDNNPYQVLEGTAGGTWHQSASLINNVSTGAPINPVIGLNLVAGETTSVIFGNYCDCKSGAKGKSWWVGYSGKTKVADGGTSNHEFNLLNALNLKTSGGLNFTLNLATAQSTNWTNLVNWLNSTSTTNAAYALSRNLAVLRLNLEAGYTKGAYFYPAFGGTIDELLADADAALGIDGSTPVGDPNRALQVQLSNWIIAINNGATVILPTPCKFYFAPPTAPTIVN